MAERYLAGQFGPLRIAVELARLQAAAESLVRSQFARARLPLLAALC